MWIFNPRAMKLNLEAFLDLELEMWRDFWRPAVAAHRAPWCWATGPSLPSHQRQVSNTPTNNDKWNMEVDSLDTIPIGCKNRDPIKIERSMDSVESQDFSNGPKSSSMEPKAWPLQIWDCTFYFNQFENVKKLILIDLICNKLNFIVDVLRLLT